MEIVVVVLVVVVVVESSSSGRSGIADFLRGMLLVEIVRMEFKLK